MSLSATLKKVAYAAPITLALTTNAFAETGLPRIEPNSTDLSKPLTTTVCVDSTPGHPGLAAWDKLVAVMSARGQMIAAEGNQVVTGSNSRQVKLITISNNFSGKEGYIISGDVPNAIRKESPGFCIRPAPFVIAVNQKKSQGVPKAVDKGELGVALRNHDKAGTKVAVVGMYNQGSIFAITFNPDTHKGGIYTADATGNKAFTAAVLEDFDYSTKMKQVFGVASADKANGKPSLVAAAKPNMLLIRAPE